MKLFSLSYLKAAARLLPAEPRLAQVLRAIFIGAFFFICAAGSSIAEESKEDLVSKARLFLCQKYSVDLSNYELKIMSYVNDSSIRENEKCRFSTFGKFWVNADFYNKEKLSRTLIMKFKLLKISEIICAKRDLRGKEPLRVEDFEVKKIGISERDHQSFVSDINSLPGKRARFLIKQGTALTQDKIEPVPLISKSDDVMVVILKEDIEIRCRGKAMEDGFAGGRLRARLDNGKIMQGTVNTQGALEVRL